MNIEMKLLTPAERMYTYGQSQQISMQTSFIGYLRADMGKDGKEFFSSWDTFNQRLNPPEFKEELDALISRLREKDGILSSRGALSRYCSENAESSFQNGRNEYGVRIDTDKYAYLLRLNPTPGNYNLYCYCYERQWLDRHMSEAEKGIRFITPDYKELFRIPDGGKIRITLSDGTFDDCTCRYIDDYHLEIGFGWNSLLHICQFAELMEKNGNTVAPLCSPAQEKAGFKSGRGCQAADPENYDGNGNLTKPRKNREYER